MKVDVVHVSEITFKRWQWWSDWIDVAVFDYSYEPFLLQMRVSRTNKKSFNAIPMSGTFRYRQTTFAAIGDLTQMGNKEGRSDGN